MNAPVIVAVAGTTLKTLEPLIVCTIVNAVVCSSPVVSSVARSNAGCVGALTVATMITWATPLASDTTVSVDTSGCAGSELWMANAPLTTSNLTERPGIGAPPGPVTVTAAVADWPEQIAFVPQALDPGVTV